MVPLLPAIQEGHNLEFLGVAHREGQAAQHGDGAAHHLGHREALPGGEVEQRHEDRHTLQCVAFVCKCMGVGGSRNMYVCMHVQYVCMYVCMYVRIYVHMHAICMYE